VDDCNFVVVDADAILLRATDPAGDKDASCSGHDIDDVLKVTKILEDAGFPCCLVDTSALIYYGVSRLRGVSSTSPSLPTIVFFTNSSCWIGLGNLRTRRPA
jgi:hypothetical protein